jgi:large subunit ribosomal protein L1
MRKRSKRYNTDAEKINRDPVGVDEAVTTLKKLGSTKFDQTVEVIMHLGIDPKQADQMIRGSISLPKGIGKSKRVIAFCEGEIADQAREAGATEVGSDDLVKRIQDGWTDFDVAVAHPSQMGKVGKLGRVLGPSGKMPSPKSGTVTPDVVTAVKEFGAGKIEYRNDDGGNIHAGVGKMSFSDDDLKENIEAFIGYIRKIKPTASKGQYIKRVTLKGTMTPPVAVAVG